MRILSWIGCELLLKKDLLNLSQQTNLTLLGCELLLKKDLLNYTCTQRYEI